jgi:hypothetical protein
MIHTESHPGWEDFEALMRHVSFIRGHRTRVEKVALVSDATALRAGGRSAGSRIEARPGPRAGTSRRARGGPAQISKKTVSSAPCRRMSKR